MLFISNHTSALFPYCEWAEKGSGSCFFHHRHRHIHLSVSPASIQVENMILQTTLYVTFRLYENDINSGYKSGAYSGGKWVLITTG